MSGYNQNMSMGNNWGSPRGNNSGSMSTGEMRSFIPGRFVMGIDEITTQEVPSDGTLALFPQRDLKAIHAMQYTAQGIIPVTYVPQVTNTAASQQPNLSELYSRMDSLEEKIDRLITKSNRQYYKNKNKNQKNGDDQA